jgi:Glycosyl hydrolases family 2/Glycosyl hydrolases family 2, sugar binding domain/Glycosyl hydrolases family 2, TIM barrel domain
VALRSLCRFCVLIAFWGGAVRMAMAATEFHHAFAPTGPYVPAPEQPYRHDLCLDGSWQFQPVTLPNNFHEGVDPAPELPLPVASAWETVPVKVPSPWNVNSFAERRGLGGDFRTFPSYPAAWESVEMGWLRRTVRIPLDWKGDRVLLHFAAVAGDVRILINGKDAGKRFDIFFPFDLDITNLVVPGQMVEILVGVRKPSLFDVKGKYGRRGYQAGSFWGQHIAGIWQDVDLVGVPPVRVARTFVQPEVSQKTLKVDVTLQNDSDADASVDLVGEVHRWTSLASKDSVEAPEPLWKLEVPVDLRLANSAVRIPAHQEVTVTLQTGVDSQLALWSPEQPNLYGLIVNVKSRNRILDAKYQRFGWREFKFKGSTVELNGKPIVLKGDSWHFLGIPQMTRRYAWAWFSALHDAHGNAVRLHAEPYPEFYLDVADEMGVMVLDETAIWASDGGPKLDSDAFWQDTKTHVAQLVLRDRNHPSVFGWSVCNEVKPVVANVFRGPPEMMQTLYGYYSIWAEIVHRLDPTRQWISADGDGDGGGRLPVNILHYAGPDAMIQAEKLGKPWGVGEAGGAYYATPEQVAKTYGERAYLSFEGRMEGIAVESYQNLLEQRKHDADYRSVFNLVWYGLRPLPLGMADTTHPPQLTDGVFFPPYEEGKAGVQPERLGPYSTTLNPGYDPALKLYETWPLFDAIKDANSDPVVKLPWAAEPPEPAHVPSAKPVQSISILSGPNGDLEHQLLADGVPQDLLHEGLPDLLFIDGRTPPGASARATMNAVLDKGRTVVVWGAAANTLTQLNALLPAPIELTNRQSSSLLPVTASPIIAGFRPSDLYFSESSPSTILDGGFSGPLIEKSTVLLEAANTDWLKWNKEAEYAKTAMVLRSERETKTSGAAIVELKQGSGRLLLINIPAWSPVYKAQLMERRLLENLGVGLNAQVDVGEPFLKNGTLVRTLAAGHFSAAGNGAANPYVDPADRVKFRNNERVQDLRWVSLRGDANGFGLNGSPLSGPADNSVVYLSFWVQSPRSLDNLLIEPNVPKLDLRLNSKDEIELFLNGKSILARPEGDENAVASGLPLQQGWNHFLVKLVHKNGTDLFSAQLTSTDATFLDALHSALQKP